MRAKGLVSAALAALAGLTACSGERIADINVNVFQDQWQAPGPIIVTDTSLTGSCPVQVQIAIVGAPNLVGDTLPMSPGNTADPRGHAIGTCVTSQAFRWESENPAAATVVSIDSSTGRITAIAPGTAGIWGIHIQTGARARFVVKVTGAAACTASNLSVSWGTTVLTIGQTTQITHTETLNPPGCATASYTASGSVTVNSTTGLVTAVSAGTGTVTITIAGQSQTQTYTVASSTVTTSVTSITLANCAGFQSSWPVTVYVGGVASTGTWTSSNSGVATVSSSGVITLTGTAGSAVITVQTSSGSATIPVTVSQCPSVVNSPSSITLANCAGYQVNWNVSQLVNGTATNATWSSSNPNVATVNSSGVVTLTGQVGTAVITSQSTSGSATTTVTVNQCAGARVDSVTISPRVWNLIVGAPDITLTATVWGSAGISQAVTWGNSQPGCATITSISQNQVTLHALMACANIVISATANADVTKTGTSTGTISSGTITCSVTDSTTGARLDSTTVVMPSGTNVKIVLVTCSNQFGTQFRPWGESNHAEIAAIVGTSNINIAGMNWPAGPYFHISRVGAGTARITFHAAVTDQTVIDWFDITFP